MYFRSAVHLCLPVLMLLGVPALVHADLPQVHLKRANLSTKPIRQATPLPISLIDLRVCAHGAGCPPSMGGWVEDTTMDPDNIDLPREFLWKSKSTTITGGRWELSSRPFPSDPASKVTLLASGNAGSPQSGRFSINFKTLPAKPPQQPGSQPVLKGKFSQVHLPPSYYVRVVPLAGNQSTGVPSNDVKIRIRQTDPTPTNPIVSMPQNVYRLDNLYFEPIHPQSLPWGCVIITGVDKSAFTGLAGDTFYTIYYNALQSGQPICPDSYKGIGEKPWYESLADFASGGVTWASSLYADIKKIAVKAVAGAINAMPGNLCNSDCETGLMQGLNAGLIALGVPPNLPNLDELTGQGMNYLVEMAASQAGIDCDQTCQDAIRSGIKEMTKEAEKKTVSNYCGDVETAHSNGREPLCLPSGVTAKPAPGSASTPAMARVRITRNPDTGNINQDFLVSYRLVLDFTASKETRSGGAWAPTNTCYSDNSVFPCDEEFFKSDGPLRGKLFATVNVPIPPLRPGQSMDMPFFLEPSDYWLPGHKERIKKKGGYVKYNDWWKLYQGAQLTVKVDVHCPHTIGNPMSSCITPVSGNYIIPGPKN